MLDLITPALFVAAAASEDAERSGGQTALYVTIAGFLLQAAGVIYYISKKDAVFTTEIANMKTMINSLQSGFSGKLTSLQELLEEKLRSINRDNGEIKEHIARIGDKLERHDQRNSEHSSKIKVLDVRVDNLERAGRTKSAKRA